MLCCLRHTFLVCALGYFNNFYGMLLRNYDYIDTGLSSYSTRDGSTRDNSTRDGSMREGTTMKESATYQLDWDSGGEKKMGNRDTQLCIYNGGVGPCVEIDCQSQFIFDANQSIIF